MESIWRSGDVSYEIFPFVEIRLKQTKPLISHFGKRLEVTSDFDFERGYFPTEHDFVSDARDLIFDHLGLPRSTGNFSEVERLALGLANILRDSIPKSKPESLFHTKRRWEKARASIDHETHTREKLDAFSVGLLLGGLLDVSLPGFYRIVEAQDLIHWGIPRHALALLNKPSSSHSNEEENLILPNPVTASNQYRCFGIWAWLSSGPKEFRFTVEFDYETTGMSLVCYSNSSWGEKYEHGKYSPGTGTLEHHLIRNLEKPDFDSNTFVRKLCFVSGEFIDFIEEIVELKSPSSPDNEWRAVPDEELTPGSTKEKWEIFDSYSTLMSKSSYKNISQVFFLSACMGGASRSVRELKTPDSVSRLLEDFFLVLRWHMTIPGSRRLDDRVSNLIFYAFPQLALKDQERRRQALALTWRMTGSEKSRLLQLLAFASDPKDFYTELKAIMDKYDEGILDGVNNSVKGFLVRNKRNNEADYSKSVSQMYDGLYNLYGAER